MSLPRPGLWRRSQRQRQCSTKLLGRKSGLEGDGGELVPDVGFDGEGERDVAVACLGANLHQLVFVGDCDDDEVVRLSPFVDECGMGLLKFEGRVYGLGHLQAGGQVRADCDVELVGYLGGFHAVERTTGSSIVNHGIHIRLET